MGNRFYSAGPFDFASCLTEELREQQDRDRRVALLYALFRLIEENPNQKERADELLDEIARLYPNDPDVLFEKWRLSATSGTESRFRVLNTLTTFLEFPEDIIHARLFLAKILSEHIGDHGKALKEIEVVRKQFPEYLEIYLASAQVRAYTGQTISEWIGDLETASYLVKDEFARASFLFETAELKRYCGESADVVSELLLKAVSLSGLDWTIVDGIRRSAEKIGNQQIVRDAVSKIAEAATSIKYPNPLENSIVDGFCGFARGDNEAAAYYWYLSQIDERLIGDNQKALESIERAQSLLPKNRLLRMERARLLNLAGRTEDAFAAVPEDSTFSELAVQAMLASKMEEAAYLVSLERESVPSLFNEVIAETLSEQIDPPKLDSSHSILQYWFDNHPAHPDALKVAQNLREHVRASSIITLFLEENTSSDRPIVEVVKNRQLEPWAHALNAIVGDNADKPSAFSNWAESTCDPILKSTLLYAASIVSEHLLGSPNLSEEFSEKARSVILEKDKERSYLELLLTDLKSSKSELEDKEYSKDLERSEHEAESKNGSDEFLKALLLLSDFEDYFAAQTILETYELEYPEDLIASLLLLDIGCKTKDLDLIVRQLEILSTKTEKDAQQLFLCSGEWLLLLNKNLEKALSFFDAAEKTNSSISGIARIYRLLALHRLGEEDAITRAVESAPVSSDKEIDNIFELSSDEDDSFEAVRILEGADNLLVYNEIEKMFSAFDSDCDLKQSLINAADHLHRLADILSPEEHSDAFKIAASLLKGSCVDSSLNVDLLDESDSKINCRAEAAIGKTGDTALQSLLSCAHKMRSIDAFEWMDWILFAAESAAQTLGPREALDIIHDGLSVSPDHPGLLEAEVRLAAAAGEFEEVADTRGRLGRFYVSQEEKVNQLVQAALILFDNLQDAQGARNLLIEAKRRNPGHAEANELLHYILHMTDDCSLTNEAELSGNEFCSDNRTSKQKKPTQNTIREEIRLAESNIAHMIAEKQWDSALEAVNSLILRCPERLSAHRTRLDLLTRAKRWEEALAAAELYFNEATHVEERRSIVFRVASIADDVLKNPDLAVSWLLRLREQGDVFEEAEKRIREIAKRSGRDFVTDMELSDKDRSE